MRLLIKYRCKLCKLIFDIEDDKVRCLKVPELHGRSEKFTVLKIDDKNTRSYKHIVEHDCTPNTKRGEAELVGWEIVR